MTAVAEVLASTSTAWTMRAKNGSPMSGTATPMAASRPARKVTASVLGTYCSSATAASTPAPYTVGDVAVVAQRAGDRLGADAGALRDLAHRDHGRLLER